MNSAATFLWYDNNAIEAARFYVSVFPNAEIVDEGTLTVSFRIGTQQFIALNGGPIYTFTPATSIYIRCDDQREIDEYWEKLTTEGGEPGRCGWLVDKYGLSWQIVPAVLGELLGSDDEAASQRAMHAMLAMNKLDIAALQAAHDGRL